MEIKKILATFTLAAALTATAFGQAGQLEPDTQKFIDALNAKGGEPIYKLPIAEARNVLESLQSQPVCRRHAFALWLPDQQEFLSDRDR